VIASPTENELIVTNPTAAKLQPEAAPAASMPAVPYSPAPAAAMPAVPETLPPASAEPSVPPPAVPAPPAATSPFGGEPGPSDNAEAVWTNPHTG
jgi:hypothetical protein